MASINRIGSMLITYQGVGAMPGMWRERHASASGPGLLGPRDAGSPRAVPNVNPRLLSVRRCSFRSRFKTSFCPRRFCLVRSCHKAQQGVAGQVPGVGLWRSGSRSSVCGKGIGRSGKTMEQARPAGWRAGGKCLVPVAKDRASWD